MEIGLKIATDLMTTSYLPLEHHAVGLQPAQRYAAHVESFKAGRYFRPRLGKC